MTPKEKWEFLKERGWKGKPGFKCEKDGVTLNISEAYTQVSEACKVKEPPASVRHTIQGYRHVSAGFGSDAVEKMEADRDAPKPEASDRRMTWREMAARAERLEA